MRWVYLINLASCSSPYWPSLLQKYLPYLRTGDRGLKLLSFSFHIVLQSSARSEETLNVTTTDLRAPVCLTPLFWCCALFGSLYRPHEICTEAHLYRFAFCVPRPPHIPQATLACNPLAG
ncbi:hypothetical protein BOTBODRAFT_497259 [Botryobasidium botryosum FD-172 SS1]|uniref:Uncharacterized protein n=1 Tax=Botryobasidium botryosum (strain FD-172 SS1) TaxID=930990 RepID=A0A067M3Y3_BOTB1|nr:hypothetical protein BOTBODRAFT_497259 [Botryobasidium botryosum FD-172 SS1]